jgi:mannose/cellobiose epimerase-like protein (N-acyl-D-glucosamine 2-epimerase family)
MDTSILEQISRHLHRGIIPFWLDRAHDDRYGGYLTNFDEAGRAYDMPEKYLNTQCRLIWFFSHLHRRHPQYARAAELAQRGVDFVIEHFWDSLHGGWYWKVRRDGSRLDDGKVSYGQSFAIYALSEYFRATADPRGLDYASLTFDLLQKYAADTRHGGYYENLEPDWTPAPPGFAGGDRKGLDTHMHLMEAFTVLYEASRQPIHRRKLLEIVGLIAHRMIDNTTGCGLTQFDCRWNCLPAIAIRRTWNAERFGEQPAQPTETTSYGHNVELEWLTTRALQTAGADIEPYKPMLRCLLDHAVTHGVDWQFGGIYRDGLRATGEPIVLEKEFWQHSEVLVGFLDGYEVFGEPRYLDAFECVWNFVKKHMIIDGVGEWRTLLDREGNVLDGKIGNPWKVAYHTGRSMIECEARLRRLTG